MGHPGFSPLSAPDRMRRSGWSASSNMKRETNMRHIILSILLCVFILAALLLPSTSFSQPIQERSWSKTSMGIGMVSLGGILILRAKDDASSLKEYVQAYEQVNYHVADPCKNPGSYASDLCAMNKTNLYVGLGLITGGALLSTVWSGVEVNASHRGASLSYSW